MAKDFSPEERLLHLIKGKHKSAFGPEEMVIPKGEEKKYISKEEEKITPAEVEKEAKEEKTPLIPSPPKGEKVRVGGPNLPYLHIISGMVLLSLMGVFVFSIFSDRENEELQNLERMVVALSKKATTETPPTEQIEQPSREGSSSKNTEPEPKTSFEEYQKLLLQRSIFAPPVKEGAGTHVPEGPALRELVTDLRLVGIVPGDEPQAIIEDKKNAQTLFLKKGEQIEGIEIRDISNGRVVLGYGEETVTLSL